MRKCCKMNSKSKNFRLWRVQNIQITIYYIFPIFPKIHQKYPNYQLISITNYFHIDGIIYMKKFLIIQVMKQILLILLLLSQEDEDKTHKSQPIH